MSSLKLSPSQKIQKNRIGSYDQEDYEVVPEHVTAQPIGADQIAMNTISKLAQLIATDAAETNTVSPKRVIKATAHLARKGDLIRFTSGSNNYLEIAVLSVPHADYIILATDAIADIANTDSFQILRHTTPLCDSSGRNIATDESLSVLGFVELSLSGVDESAYTTLLAAASNTWNTKKLQIFTSTGESLYLATGGAGSESNKLIVPPGGFVHLPISHIIASGTRLSVKSVNAPAVALSTEKIIVNFLG